MQEALRCVGDMRRRKQVHGKSLATCNMLQFTAMENQGQAIDDPHEWQTSCECKHEGVDELH